MALEHDILARIKADFSREDAAEAVALLKQAGKHGRVARCIVYVASGSLDVLRQCIDLAEQDFRDLIVVAEYEGMDNRVRDFTASFLIDSPRKMWIAPVADAMSQRGYSMSSLEVVQGVGSATFEGKSGTIAVTRDRGLWRLHGKKAELQLYGLCRAFEDVEEFVTTLSCYILAKENPRR